MIGSLEYACYGSMCSIPERGYARQFKQILLEEKRPMNDAAIKLAINEPEKIEGAWMVEFFVRPWTV